jgi:hypothetical protein
MIVKTYSIGRWSDICQTVPSKTKTKYFFKKILLSQLLVIWLSARLYNAGSRSQIQPDTWTKGHQDIQCSDTQH